MEATQYLNHGYLFCWLSWVMCFLPAHRCASFDVQRKPETKVDRGDEDGPASEDNVDEVAEETSDEDPMSEDDENPKEDEIEDSLPLERPPRVAWRGRQDACYVGYFERQRGAHCGMRKMEIT